LIGGTVPKIVELGAVASESIAIVSAHAVKRTRTGAAGVKQALMGDVVVIFGWVVTIAREIGGITGRAPAAVHGTQGGVTGGGLALIEGTVPEIVVVHTVAKECGGITRNTRTVGRTRVGDASRGQTFIGGAIVVVWPGTGAPEVTGDIIVICIARTVGRTWIGVT